MIAMQDRDQTLREMSQSYGLYFFFRSNCAYCHVEAPMLKQFSRKYGFTVFPVSLDGGTLPDFPRPAMDNGIALQVSSALGIPPQHFVVPAVVLARPSANQVVPVGFGAMTMDEMADRITSVVRVQQNGAGQPAASAVQALVGDPGIGAAGRPAGHQGRAADQGFTLR
jgi:conjugal transfer pilus assembly protein TraF